MQDPQEPTPPRPELPGRPPAVKLDRRGVLREQKFREAAIAVLLEKGYRHTRLSDVVALAKGSLATLYRIYGDKEGLVHAIMAESIANFGQSLEGLAHSQLPPTQALTDAAESMVEEFLSPARIVCHRIVIGEGAAYPELRDWFLQNAVRPPTEALADYFERGHRRGELAIEHTPYLTAERFYMAVLGTVIIRSMSGSIGPADVAAEKRTAREAVALFMDGIRPRPG